MPAQSTYDSLATQTLGTSSSIINFNSISGLYTDLVVVLIGQTTGGADSVGIRLNADNAGNYMYRVGSGNGSGTGSSAVGNNETSLRVGPFYATQSLVVANIAGYSNSSIWKTSISRASNGDNQVGMTTSVWRGTAAVTSLSINALFGSFAAGTMATIYGIGEA